MNISRTFLCHLTKASLAAIISLLLTACGFQPLMATKERGGQAAGTLARVQVLPISERSGQILRNNLVDTLGSRGSAAAYTLEVRLSEPRQEIAIRRDESASRISYTANAVFILRSSDGTTLFNSISSSSSTYEASNSELASISAQRNARDRAMEEISADIRQQLAAYFLRTQTPAL